MTTTDVIEMARKAGGYDGFTSPPTDWDEGDFVISPGQLLKFATLVRNAALEECASEIEALRAEVKRLRADRDSWEQQASDRVADWHAEHLRAERLAEALEDIRSRSCMKVAMNPNLYELTTLLGDIHQIADSVLTKENSND